MLTEEENRSRIMDAAISQFVTRGYSAVTMNDIATDLGMSKKTLYKYFDNKHALLETVVQRHLDSMQTVLDDIYLDPNIEFHDKLRNVLSLVTAETNRMGLQVMVDVKRNAPKVWEYIENWRGRHIRSRFAMMLDEGVQKGFFRNDLNREIVVSFYLSSLEQLFNAQSAGSSKFGMHELLDHFLKLFYEGLVTDEARRQYRAAAIGQTMQSSHNS